MKVVLAHDYLNQLGGAERVLKSLTNIFPDAKIYTLLYDNKRTNWIFRGRMKRTGFLNYIPFSKSHHRLFIPLMPLASSLIKIKSGDLIISDSAGFAKGFNSKSQFHIAYCHTPLRYAWEENYLTSKFGFIKNKAIQPIFKKFINYLQNWDFEAAQKPDILIANSRFIANKIKIFYGREALVVYPPVDQNIFNFSPQSEKKDYFLAVGRMLHYKKFDLIIKSFNDLKLPLKIIGNGPELENLKKLNTSPNTEFLGYINDENQLKEFYNQARALIFPQIEDFGLVAAEAQSCGLPVIAYNAGGSLEIVKDGETGILFANQNPESLTDAIRRFESQKFDRAKIAEIAERFSEKKFRNEILKLAREAERIIAIKE
ncbi:glycosyltransferase [Patescibacteria group bacterium]|nr:glycosyltransferase [Patescibacteria group bacterium]MCL5733532.1 glycosyltransferase [Patescibacteria group bacterium]